ncbi:unnamed protein product [Nesidiocoris tenuis]|uniref:Uncharacterized protein n=1 Tax=Nesidiocoris tenuis TaxID=355587 RepID=A0A6H5GBT6_9HEMI|nr:unnamed protein product [Nesidiocoris tenuis]
MGFSTQEPALEKHTRRMLEVFNSLEKLEADFIAMFSKNWRWLFGRKSHAYNTNYPSM